MLGTAESQSQLDVGPPAKMVDSVRTAAAHMRHAGTHRLFSMYSRSLYCGKDTVNTVPLRQGCVARGHSKTSGGVGGKLL